MLSQKISPESITRKTKGFSVAASPLNPVKFELIVVFIVGGLFWLLLSGLGVDGILQVVFLGLYGVGAMVWIVFRTKQILKKVLEVKNSCDEKS